MIMNDTENIFYEHYKTGNVYRVISRDKMMECPVTEMWWEAVEYEEYLHKKPDGTYSPVPEPRRFIRNRNRFGNCFNPWKHE